MSQSSICNQLRVTVAEVVRSPVVSEVAINAAAGTISAVVATRTVDAL